MSAAGMNETIAPARRGWCPDVHAPMRSGDGWLVRVKPPHGGLTPAQADAVAEAAARWGSGVIELTARANLQLRGIDQAALPAVAAAMVAAGLAEADPLAERRRNVIVSPLLGSDPDLHPATARVADAVLAHLRRSRAVLPAKHGYLIDGGGSRPLAGLSADVVLRLAPGAAAPPVGYVSYRAAARGSIGVAASFGHMTAAALRELAALALRGGDGKLRVTPWRAVLIAEVARRRADALLDEAARLGLVVRADDARLRIAACPGAPSCGSGLAPARADAALLAAHAAMAGGVLADGRRVHVSGCTKGCAHPQPAAITLIGTANGYALVRDGRAGDAPAATGLSLPDCIALMAGT